MLIVMGAIFFLSHQTGDSSDLQLFPGADKLAHMVIYGVLAASVIYAFPDRLRQPRSKMVFWGALGVSTLYGFTDEFHQSFIAGRHTSGFDILADVVGAGMVCVIWYWRGRSKNWLS
jgi:VanZ family protein